MSAPPDLSVVIPVYNRGELIRHTLESVRLASAGLSVETIVVDDGSDAPAGEEIARLGFHPSLVLRQPNRGLLFARLAGLERATGRNLLFLDSDDFVSPEKFRAQVAALDGGSDVTYTDQGSIELRGEFDPAAVKPSPPFPSTADSADFYLNIQPAPHSPVFRTDYLRAIVQGAFFPPSPLYNSVAEIWFYHNAAPRPARVRHLPGLHTIVGHHPGVRLTNHWEKLGVASLAVMEAFARSVPASPATGAARRIAGEVAFRSWRRLPRDFSGEFQERQLNVWRRMPPGAVSALGGPLFQRLARLLGPERAGRLLRLLQGGRYAGCRTLPAADVARLLAALPPP